MLYFFAQNSTRVASYPSYLSCIREWVNRAIVSAWFYEHPYCTCSDILLLPFLLTNVLAQCPECKNVKCWSLSTSCWLSTTTTWPSSTAPSSTSGACSGCLSCVSGGPSGWVNLSSPPVLTQLSHAFIHTVMISLVSHTPSFVPLWSALSHTCLYPYRYDQPVSHTSSSESIMSSVSHRRVFLSALWTSLSHTYLNLNHYDKPFSQTP